MYINIAPLSLVLGNYGMASLHLNTPGFSADRDLLMPGTLATPTSAQIGNILDEVNTIQTPIAGEPELTKVSRRGDLKYAAGSLCNLTQGSWNGK